MLGKIFAVTSVILLLMSGLVLAQGIIIKSSLKTGLNDPDIYLSLGEFLMANGFPEAAFTAYEKALSLDADNIAALNNLGYYYKDTNPLLAEDYFKRALMVDSSYETARNNLALLYNKIGQYSRAVEQLKILAAASSNNLHYNYDLAINLANSFYYQTKSYDDLIEAIKYFKIVYTIEPNFEHTLDNIKVLEEIRRTIENR